MWRNTNIEGSFVGSEQTSILLTYDVTIRMGDNLQQKFIQHQTTAVTVITKLNTKQKNI